MSVLLVRWESFGDNGTSGTLQCVVNEPASEHEPRTELYIADTLKQTIKTSRNQTHGKEKKNPPNMQNFLRRRRKKDPYRTW